MNQSSRDDPSTMGGADQESWGEDDPISARERLAAPHRIEPLRALTLLTPEELVEVLQRRVIIEQAKGMLMFAYGIDADSAFDLLRLCSQSTNVKLRIIAEQLAADLVETARDGPRDLRQVCDNVLVTVHERVRP